MEPDKSGRTLQTARSALQVLKMMSRAKGGVRTQDVADALGKSVSTAIYLLNSLCSEGFAVRDGADGHYRLIDDEPAPRSAASATTADLAAAISELYGRTNERSYLARIDDPLVVIDESLGRQGLPYVPGLKPQIGAEAHALAVGKVILAYEGSEAVEAHRDAYGLSSYTQRTVVGVDQLEAELADVRRLGFAVDREEYAEGFCCVAAPIFDADNGLHGVLALSTTRSRFDERIDDLASDVLTISRAASRSSAPAVGSAVAGEAVDVASEPVRSSMHRT